MNSRGFSLIEVIVVMAMISILSLGGVQMFDYINREKARVDLMLTLQAARNRLASLIDDQDAWNQIVAKNPGLKCLDVTLNIPCVAGTAIAPTIYNQSGVAIFNPKTQGFTNKGDVCDQASGPLCLIGFDIKTTLTCAPAEANCKNPSVATRGQSKLLSNPVNINVVLSNYQFESLRGRRSLASLKSEIPYSTDCSTWKEDGWPSRMACIQDGRWHVVFKNTQFGNITAGSINELENHIKAGADIKVTGLMPQGFTDKCQAVYRNGGSINCLTPTRFAGDVPPFIENASTRYTTDGSVWCNSVGFPNVNKCGGWKLPMEWHVKY